MEKDMDKELIPSLMGLYMQVNLRMAQKTDKEFQPIPMA